MEPLRSDLIGYLEKHQLKKKWEKAIRLFEYDFRHPSLHTELLEPRWRGIYSFRLDKKHRALFFITNKQAEIFQITKHYRKAWGEGNGIMVFLVYESERHVDWFGSGRGNSAGGVFPVL